MLESKPLEIRLTRDDWLGLCSGMVGFPLLFLGHLAYLRVGLSREILPTIAEISSDPIMWVLTLLFEFIYAPVTAIALQNVKFRPLLKYSFCLIAAPAFGGLMIVNIAWSSTHLEYLVGLAVNASGKSG